MKDRYFLDTNVIVYSFDQTAPSKKAIAETLIQKALKDHCGCVSFQVVQEFISVAIRKFDVPLSYGECRSYVDDFLGPITELFPSLDFYRESMEVSERWQYSFYDSMIINAAINTNCSLLYSEDMQNNQKIKSITIKNPFE
ncbi:MAG: PIN domain-containing protein [Proteobacteria bacterium]|nr:PIN domain-containing protein [Pseudomonadota bacterium]